MPDGKCSFRSFLPIIMKNTRSVKSCFPYVPNSTMEKFGECLELLASFFGISVHWLYWSRKTNVLKEIEEWMSRRRRWIAEQSDRRKTTKWDFSQGVMSIVQRVQCLNIIQYLGRLTGRLMKGLCQWYAVWENERSYQELVLGFLWQFCRKKTQTCNWLI